MDKDVIGLFKDGLGGKLMTEFVGLREKNLCILNG